MKRDGRTEGRTYRADVLRFLMVIFHYKFMGLTPETHFNPITHSYPKPNLTKNDRLVCITPLCTRVAARTDGRRTDFGTKLIRV